MRGHGMNEPPLACPSGSRSYRHGFSQSHPQSFVQRHRSAAVYFHLHLVSDSTGETLNAVAKAACAQFEMGRPIEHIYPLVRNRKQVERALVEIEGAPGLVFHTMVNPELRLLLEDKCR